MIVRVTDLERLPAAARGGVVAIGNFDGLHRGHRSVLGEALTLARQAGVPAGVLTFEPHPRTVFAPDRPVFRLTPAPMKARILDLLGFDTVFEERFDRDLASVPAEDFVARILVERLAVSHVVTGFDFHFGKGRAGTPDVLAALGDRFGFGVTLVPAYADEGGETVSSSRIRDCLAEGDVAAAAGLLGYRYTVMAAVDHGKKLGRTLGYPTANMVLPHQTGLKPGIYAVRLRRADGSLHDGVASFGRRPTTDADDAPLLLETFIFDGTHDLYGETCAVSFFGFLRPELRFDGLDPLIAQMKMDEAEARAVLSDLRPLGELDARLCF